MQRVIFVVLPYVEILDLAGPVQVFHEANRCGAAYRVLVCSTQPQVRTEQGLSISDLEPLPEPEADDLVLVPGFRMAALDPVDPGVLAWLRKAHERGAQMASICTGAFVLGRAGLLEDRQCTTHWSRVDDLQRCFPSARVLTNRLFVDDGPVTTSAGIASGIDMALALVERRHGPLVAAAAARELVVYLRRDGGHRQDSIYLDYRTHLHPGVHRVQDWLIAHPGEPTTLDDLARTAAMSPRNLTRAFRQADRDQRPGVPHPPSPRARPEPPPRPRNDDRGRRLPLRLRERTPASPPLEGGLRSAAVGHPEPLRNFRSPLSYPLASHPRQHPWPGNRRRRGVAMGYREG